ncbi:MAG: RsmE family RNA methyltransferase [Pseudomonadota bacterium]
MRAILLDNINFNEFSSGHIFKISGDKAHHLINVVRAQLEEKILLLNGKGLSAIAQINRIDKKEVHCRVQTCTDHSQLCSWDLAVGITKKEATEDVVRITVELGVRALYPLLTQYSQQHWISSDRQERIVESAIIQSNNPWRPQIFTPLPLMDLIQSRLSEYDLILVFIPGEVSTKLKDLPSSLKDLRILILIGPEGGLSPDEETQLQGIQGVQSINLSSPILRTPTAIIAAWGYLLGYKR